jgi:hypothetical protein
MIHTEPIEALVNIALHTAFIKGDKPQSLLIVSQIENGKTKLVSQFRDNDFVAFPHDVTAYGIVTDYLPQLKDGKLKFLIFPEFIQPLSRNRDTVKTFLTFLNGLIEDGITDISTYATHIHLEKPIYAGVIACLAIGEFIDNKSSWAKSGFLSRFLPVTYNYSHGSATDIFEAIYREKINVENFKLRCTETEVKIPVDIAKSLNSHAVKLAFDMDKNTKVKGYRAQVQLQRMIKGLALVNGRTVVTEEDLAEFIELLKYVNLDYNEL